MVIQKKQKKRKRREKSGQGGEINDQHDQHDHGRFQEGWGHVGRWSLYPPPTQGNIPFSDREINH